MYVIGLTGGMGSGKTTVGRWLEEKGAALLQADLIAHEVYAAGTPGWQQVVDAFGPDVVAPDGSIDRSRLGAIVFRDREALLRLNAITHPATRDLLSQRLAQLAAGGTEIAVLEAALLLEAEWESLVDEVWVLAVPDAIAVGRITEKTGMSQEDARLRILTQLTNEDRRERADVLIDSGGSLAETKREVDRAWGQMLERASAGLKREKAPH